MAVRVRKLAKELRRDAEELLGILHALGFTRFRSTQDMLSDRIVLQLKRAVRDGVTPQPMGAPVPANVAIETKIEPNEEQAYSESELTMDLSDWVQKGENSHSQDPSILASETERVRLRKEQALSNKVAELESEVHRLEQLLNTANARAEELSAERDATLEKGSDTIDVSLVDLLEARGLLGHREFQAALRSLLNLPIEHDWIRTLWVKSPDTLEEVLRERLVFVGGESDSLTRSGKAAVVVTSERVERASDVEWLQTVEQISETLLLFGLRRVIVVGGEVGVITFLRQHLDRRIQFSSATSKTRSVTEAEIDVHRNDLVVLWAVETTEEARSLYDASKSDVICVKEGGLDELSDALKAALG